MLSVCEALKKLCFPLTHSLTVHFFPSRFTSQLPGCCAHLPCAALTHSFHPCVASLFGHGAPCLTTRPLLHRKVVGACVVADEELYSGGGARSSVPVWEVAAAAETAVMDGRHTLVERPAPTAAPRYPGRAPPSLTTPNHVYRTRAAPHLSCTSGHLLDIIHSSTAPLARRTINATIPWMDCMKK